MADRVPSWVHIEAVREAALQSCGDDQILVVVWAPDGMRMLPHRLRELEPAVREFAHKGGFVVGKRRFALIVKEESDGGGYMVIELHTN